MIARLWFWIAVTGFAGWFWHGSAAAETACPAVPPVVIATRIDERPVVLRHDLSIESLTAYAQNNRDIRLVDPSAHLGGLTDSELRVRTKIKFLIYQRSDGAQVCLAVGGADIELLLAPTVFIVKNKPKGSCAYSETLNHENKHISTDRQLMRDYRRDLEQAVRDVLATQPRIASITPDQRIQRQEEWQARIETAVARVFTALQAERDHRQSLVDTPEEYQRVAMACRS